MVGSGPHQAESMEFQREDHFVNLKRRRDRDVNVHTAHSSRSQSKNASPLSYGDDTRALQLEINHLKRKLRHERRKRTLSISGSSIDNDEDCSYRCRSRTPPRESFSYDEDIHHKRKSRNSSSKGLGNDTMSRALNQISKSPFTCKIEGGRGPMAMRWFDGLGASSIDSFKELTQVFGSCFIMCSKVPWPLDSLLSLSMREWETLKTYSDRYCEIFNEIDGNFDDVAIRTFKVDLPTEHGLRKSLTGKPATSVRQLMDRIDKYKRVEEDQQQGKGKSKVISQERRDFGSDCYNNSRPKRDFAKQSGSTAPQVVNIVFREPVHQVLEKIKNESYFKWLNKMGGNPLRHNQSLHCQYHQEWGHTTEDCRTLWNHLK